MASSTLTSSSSPFVPSDTLYIISTHAKCFDGAAAAAILELYCTHKGYKHVNVPHILGKSFLREFGSYLQTGPVTLLMFDVSPDEELADVILSKPQLHFVCGDHHVGNKPTLGRLMHARRSNISIMYDDNKCGAQLAWEWVQQSVKDMAKLSLVVDGVAEAASSRTLSRLLDAICAFDLFVHKGNPELEAVEACLRLQHQPDTATLKAMLTTPGKYDEIVMEGALCARIMDNMAKDLLQRGRLYRLSRHAVTAVRMHGALIPEACSVFYVQGTLHLSSEMGYLHSSADLVFIWSKNELAPKKYAVSVRRGRPSDIRCDIVVKALTQGRCTGHAAAAGMAFDTEPTFLLV